LHVEGEPAGLVAALAGLRGAREQVADVREDARVRSRVGPGRAADGALVDLDDLVYVLDAGDPLVSSGRGLGAVQRLRQRRPEDGVDEGRLAGPRRAGHAGERAERDADVDVLEVVLARALDDEALAVALTAAGRHGDLLVATQVRCRQRALVS